MSYITFVTLASPTNLAKFMLNTFIYGIRYEKLWVILEANNKDADQPARPRSLVSVIVVRLLDSIIVLYTSSKVLRGQLVCVAVLTRLRAS